MNAPSVNRIGAFKVSWGKQGMKTNNSLREWLFRPRVPENPFQKAIIAVIRVIYIVLYNTYHDLIMLRAAALTYTVILSIVPLLALGTAVLKGLGAGDQMRQAAYVMIANFEATITGDFAGVPPIVPEGGKESGVEGGGARNSGDGVENCQVPDAPERGSVKKKVSATMLVHLRNAVDKVFDYVDHTNFATLGIFGMSGLLVVVLLMLDSVEEAINAIWKPARMRPVGRRLMDHAALLIILPLAVNAGFAAIAAIQSQKLMQLAMYWFPFKGFFVLVFRILPVAMVIGTFALVYRFLPNTRVEALPALVGAVVGGLIWLVVQIVYLKLQLGVARYNAIYGSFATFPLVLIWIYMGWLSLLVGAEVSFAVQVWRQFRIGKRELSPAEIVACCLDVAVEIFRFFREEKPVGAPDLSVRTGLMEDEIRDILKRLEGAKIIRRVGEDGAGEQCLFVPAGPSDVISPEKVLAAVMGRVSGESWGSNIASRAVAGARREVAQEVWPSGC